MMLFWLAWGVLQNNAKIVLNAMIRRSILYSSRVSVSVGG